MNYFRLLLIFLVINLLNLTFGNSISGENVSENMHPREKRNDTGVTNETDSGDTDNSDNPDNSDNQNDQDNSTNIDHGNYTNTNDSTHEDNSNESDKSSLEKLEDFFTIGNIIMAALIIVLVLAFIYSCTCFDRRQPPLDYKDIEWEEGENWVRLDTEIKT